MFNILVLGDSFAEHADGWPAVLERSLDMPSKVTVRAQAGTGIYYAYRRLIEQKRAYDFYLVLVSGYQRLFVTDEYSTNGNYTGPADNDVQKAIRYYYDHLYSDDYHRLTHRLILEDMRKTIRDLDRPSFFMPCFNNEVSMIEHPFCLADFESEEHKIAPGFHKHTRKNHLLPINNNLLALYFKDMIMSGSSRITPSDVRAPSAY